MTNYHRENKMQVLPIPDKKSNSCSRFFSVFCYQTGLNPQDIPYLVICLSALIYFTFHDPLFVTVLGCLSLCLMALWQVTRALPVIETHLGRKIRFWHVATIILALTNVLSIVPTPAQALFLSGLETFFVDLVSQSNSSIDQQAVTLVFNLIRGIFLILVAAAGLFAYNQAQQGNDWRPIVTQVGIAFGTLICIDIITYLFTGT